MLNAYLFNAKVRMIILIFRALAGCTLKYNGPASASGALSLGRVPISGSTFIMTTQKSLFSTVLLVPIFTLTAHISAGEVRDEGSFFLRSRFSDQPSKYPGLSKNMAWAWTLKLINQSRRIRTTAISNWAKMNSSINGCRSAPKPIIRPACSS